MIKKVSFLVFFFISFILFSDEKIDITPLLLSNKIRDVRKAILIAKKKSEQDLYKAIIYGIANNKSIRIKTYLIGILKRLDIYESANDILQILKREKNEKAMVLLIGYLGFIKNRDVVYELCKYILSPYMEVRRAAVLSLKEIGDERMYPYIMRLLVSADELKKVYALDALYFLGNERLVPLILEFLKSPNKSVRLLALRILAKFHTNEMENIIGNIIIKDRNSEVKIKALEIADRWYNPNLFHSVVKALSDKDFAVRKMALKIIIKHSDSKALPYVNRLATKENVISIKFMILNYYETVKSPHSFQGLLYLASKSKNIKIRYLSIALMGYLRIKLAIPYLKSYIKDNNPYIRAEAIHSLCYFRNLAPTILKQYLEEKDIYVKTSALFCLKRIAYKQMLDKIFNSIFIEKDKFIREEIKKVFLFLLNKVIHK
jgi:HEAT repeat protein